MTRLHEEVQRVIIDKRLITPETLKEGLCGRTDMPYHAKVTCFAVKKHAEAAQGAWVVEACQNYESNNEAIIQSFARAHRR